MPTQDVHQDTHKNTQPDGNLAARNSSTTGREVTPSLASTTSAFSGYNEQHQKDGPSVQNAIEPKEQSKS